MVTAFDRCRAFERQYMAETMLPFLRTFAADGVVRTDKGRLAAHLQVTVGDALVNSRRTGDVVAIECKAEKQPRVNFFLEEWSNKPKLERVSSWDKPGWMHTCESDVLAYLIAPRQVVYTMRMPALRKWFRANAERFRLAEQKRHVQRNRAWGRLVPIAHMSTVPSVRMLQWDVSCPTSPRLVPPPEFAGGGRW